MEYFDVLDKNRKNLNYKKLRGEKLEENEFNQGAELWIFNDGRLLLTKRCMEKSHPGEWETPGGCSQQGETSIATILREVKEEIGITLSRDDLKLIGTQLYKKQFVDVFRTNKMINSSDINLQVSEVSDFKFVSKKQFLEMIDNCEVVKSVSDRYFMFKEIIDIDW